RVEDGIALVLAVAVRPLRHARAFRVGLAASIATCQPASRKRAEHLVAEAVLVADGEDRLRVGLLEQRERILHPLEADESLELRELHRLGELLAREVRGADRSDLAGSH